MDALCICSVRVNPLLCLGELVCTTNVHATLEILQTVQQRTVENHSAPTLMCDLGFVDSILKQFAKHMLFVKDIPRWFEKMEEKQGVFVTDSGIPEIGVTPVLNETLSQPSVTTSRPVSSTA
ncbi:hypothetical protein C5167_000933 [Papaver somniferum]|uniref:Uncharacterized protein n=1 Tax=Papaver somniferum TaxID=3469 RepID=A0A4Y7KV59_PAPSO|nr:hypothetical protein C5167_000933 [Papaver somniferum]